MATIASPSAMAERRAGLRGILTGFAGTWGNVVLAAVLILATLPGRTLGLGLITESLLLDFHLDRVTYADMNLWATLIGALFCLPAGWLIDHYGLRRTTLGILGLLALTVAMMSTLAHNATALFLLVVLSRGLGQSALTVASITAVGKSGAARAGWPMGVYAMLFNVFLASGFLGVGWVVLHANWHRAWLLVALGLVAVMLVVAVFLRESEHTVESTGISTSGKTLGVALAAPVFWVFAGGTALFLIVFSGFGLFNQAILAERGFDPETYVHFLAFTQVCALPGQAFCGWLSLRQPMTRILGGALFFFAGGLAALPLLHSVPQLWLFGVLFGTTAGFINVTYFAVWGHAFGRAHLGRIQGAAQMTAVLATAVGPLLFAKCQAITGSYTPIIVTMAAITLGASFLVWQTKLVPHTSPPPP